MNILLRNLYSRIIGGKSKVNTFITLTVFSLSLIPLLWFRGDQILLGYDNVYPLSALDFLRDRLFTWSSIQGFGMDQSGQQGSLIIHFIDSVPQFFGASHQLSQKIIFSFWFFLLLLSSYLFIVSLEKNRFLKNKSLRYIFPVMYAINFYVLQAWWVAERTKFSMMVALPLILTIVFPLINKRFTIKSLIEKSIICSMILTIFNGGGWGGLSLYGGLLITLLTFFLLYFLTAIAAKNYKQAISLFLFFVFLTAFYLAFNAYTLLPFFLSTFKEYNGFLNGVGGINGLISWTRYLSENTSFLNLLRLQGIPDWYNSVLYHPYASTYLRNIFFVSISFLFPLFLLLSLVINRTKEKFILRFFTLLLLVSLFFTAGSHAPLGFVYEFLMKKVPGFIIFRSAFFKFGYSYWLAASILIGLFFSNALDYLSLKFNKKLVLSFVFPLMVVLLLLYNFPYLTGNIFKIDKADVRSIVGIPSYVSDFANWWRKNGENNKVLLLPKLNENFLFEQYRWKYLSLFPVLGNFAANGLVENTDQLTGSEMNLINRFYKAINDSNYNQMNDYSSSLGIGYFLVRKDFYFDLSGQETDSPVDVEEKIKNNPNISFVKSFGEWSLYKHNLTKPLFYAKNKAVVVEGKGATSIDLSGNLLQLDADMYGKYPFLFNRDLVYPECISCKAEIEDVSVQIPKPKILLDSSLRNFVQFRDRLQKPKSESYDQHLFRLVGETLKSAGQISELIYQDKGDIYVDEARTEYIDHLNSLSNDLKEIEYKSSNPYLTAVTIEYYLEDQNNFLYDLLQKSSLRTEQINIEKILYKLNKLNDVLNAFYGSKNFNINKYYSYDIKRSKEYEIKMLRSSLGVLDDNDLSKINISLDNNIATISPNLDNEFLDFGKTSLSAGKHKIKLFLPEQKNILSALMRERISGSNCFSSFIDDFSPDANYGITFSSKNNFDPSFFYFIDGGKEFSPVFVGYLSISGEQIKDNRVVVSPSGVHLNEFSGRLRISFCSRSLNESLYSSNIKNLKAVILTSPEIILRSDMENKATLFTPKINFVKIDQGHYRVFVKDATDAFILSFTQRYSDGWRAKYLGKGRNEIGHGIGDGFKNVWIINKKGNFAVDISYGPQEYFYIGVILSMSSLVGAIAFLYFNRGSDEKI